MARFSHHHPFLRWFSYALVPLTSWIIILFPLWLGLISGDYVAYILIAFYLYYLSRGIFVTYKIFKSLNYIQQNKDRTFLYEIQDNPVLHNFVIIPNYKEPLGKLKKTIESILNAQSPKDTMRIVMAFEERDDSAYDKELKLRELFADKCDEIIATYHKIIPGEIVGKASNQTYAAKKISEHVRSLNINVKDVMITICDADSIFAKNYFSYLNYAFYSAGSIRYYKFFWAPILFYTDFWKLKFFIKPQAIMSSLGLVAMLQERVVVQMSTYSLNLWLAESVGYWDTDIVPEDWHMYLQAFFKHDKLISTIPLYTLNNSDAINAPTHRETFLGRYDQERRWAWGVTDVGYAILRLIEEKGKNFWSRLNVVSYVAINHLLWPTTFFVVTIAAFIPGYVDKYFEKTVIAFMLPKIASFLLSVTTVLLVFYMYADIKLRSWLHIPTPINKIPSLFIQFLIMPVISFFLTAVPSLDAHTKLIFGKSIEYKVAEKYD